MSPNNWTDVYRIDITHADMKTTTTEYRGCDRAHRAYNAATHSATTLRVTLKQFMHLGDFGEFVWTNPIKEWRNSANGS
jgi:hypothetical protein